MKSDPKEISRAPISLPQDFAERSRVTNARIEAGEPMTMQYLADALGIPFEFVAACIGLAEALKTGKPVVIDPALLTKFN